MTKQLRVLIVEDNPIVSLDLEEVVETRGHLVVATSASSAEARCNLDEPLDFALLDVDVVDGTTYGLAGELQDRGVPFAFITASLHRDLPTPLRPVGFVSKPYSEAGIASLLEEGVAA